MNGPVEPDANSREFARNLYQVFTALRQEGFTEPQAISIVGQILLASFNGDSDDS